MEYHDLYTFSQFSEEFAVYFCRFLVKGAKSKVCKYLLVDSVYMHININIICTMHFLYATYAVQYKILKTFLCIAKYDLLFLKNFKQFG